MGKKERPEESARAHFPTRATFFLLPPFLAFVVNDSHVDQLRGCLRSTRGMRRQKKVQTIWFSQLLPKFSSKLDEYLFGCRGRLLLSRSNSFSSPRRVVGKKSRKLLLLPSSFAKFREPLKCFLSRLRNFRVLSNFHHKSRHFSATKASSSEHRKI